MKNLTNTAKVEYTTNNQRRMVFSNTLSIPVIISNNTLKGRVIATGGCKKWVLNLIDKTSCQLVYSMQGCSSRNFSFNVNPVKEYVVEFTADNQCSLRLYNTPDAVTNIKWNNQ